MGHTPSADPRQVTIRARPTQKRKVRLTSTKIFHLMHIARVMAHTPLYNMCSTSSDNQTLDNRHLGVGSSLSDALTSDSPSLGAGRVGLVGGRFHRGATTTGAATPPLVIQAWVSSRDCANSPTYLGSSQGGSALSH